MACRLDKSIVSILNVPNNCPVVMQENALVLRKEGLKYLEVKCHYACELLSNDWGKRYIDR